MSRSLGPEFDYFLRDVLPSLGLDWRRHRRRGVRRRVAERLRRLGLRSFDDYRELLQRDESEKKKLALMMGVTISRFFRDIHIFDYISEAWLDWNEKEKPIMLSLGCANGEEPYTLAMLWLEKGPGQVKPLILAMDMDYDCLIHAQNGRYPFSSIKEVPSEYREKYFKLERGEVLLDEKVKSMVHFYQSDLRTFHTPALLNLVLCRNSAFTYFDDESRVSMTERIAAALKPGGLLLIGSKEKIEAGAVFEFIDVGIYRRRD